MAIPVLQTPKDCGEKRPGQKCLGTGDTGSEAARWNHVPGFQEHMQFPALATAGNWTSPQCRSEPRNHFLPQPAGMRRRRDYVGGANRNNSHNQVAMSDRRAQAFRYRGKGLTCLREPVAMSAIAIRLLQHHISAGLAQSHNGNGAITV